MPSPATLAAFAAAAFVLIAVPGPNLIYLVARSVYLLLGAYAAVSPVHRTR
jgi:threonine/homoserine/homoserine lactone efflux protein